MVLPTPDEPAYSGDRVVKTVTYGKSKKSTVSGIRKVKESVDSLNKAVDKLLTFDAIDPNSKYSIETQVLVNKLAAAKVRAEALKLATFVKNHS